MSDKDLARRCEIRIVIDDTDVTSFFECFLISVSYTDNEEDKTDDLQITIKDPGTDTYAWLFGLKGSSLNAVIVHKNVNSDGKDLVLDCGDFEIDTIDLSGPPSKISFKCTSLPHKSTVRTQNKTRAWEKISLNMIANEIASLNEMKCMFESSYNPFYERKEQIQCSDIVFLKELCKNSGIALKVTSNMLVLFDAYEYEQKETIRKIVNGEDAVKSYRFSTQTNDVTYGSCHVIYTNPQTKETIEYTYKPKDSDETAQVLEINEKVSTKEEARQLAMKRLRQKNKNEFKAELTLYGDTSLVAGVTVNIEGFGFDGKYIVNTATHTPTGGYSVSIDLRRVLEDY